MKKISLLVLLAAFSLPGTSQVFKKLEVKSVQLRDAGSIIQNGIVKGYYSFYNLEKKDRKNNNYQLTVTDENLREVNSVNIVRPNSYLLVDAVFNGSAFGFLFFDYKEKSLELISYDNMLKEGGKATRELSNKFASMPYQYIAQGHEPMQAFLLAVPNKGFLFYGIKEDSKSDYQIEFFNNAMKRVWVANAPKDDFDFETAGEAFQDEQFVGSLIIKRTGLFDLNPDFDLLVQNVNDGTPLFRIPMTTAKYKMALAELSFDQAKQQFLLFGEYFEKKDNVIKDESQGFITLVLDMKGKITSEKINSWIDISARVEAKDKKQFEKTSVLFHDFIRTSDGEFFAVGEQYKKGGLPMAVKLNVYNMVIFQFDANFAIKKVHIFEKDKNSVQMPPGMLIASSKLLSYIAKSYGGFDYLFTQLSPGNDTFTINYINYDREKGQKGKNQLGSIVYTPEKTFAVDKLDLNRKSVKYFVYRAKQGFVMISEYFEKEKTIESRLEKINF